MFQLFCQLAGLAARERKDLRYISSVLVLSGSQLLERGQCGYVGGGDLRQKHRFNPISGGLQR